MEVLIVIGLWVLMALWCVSIAKKNGRNTVWAAIWGVVFGLLAVIIYALVGKTRQQDDEDFARRLKISQGWQTVGNKKVKK